MGMVVNHNISALNTLRNLNSSNRAMSKSLQKLSSGYRINTGSDGPADLIISEKLRAQKVGLERAVRNTQEAQNVIGIAEGALNEMNSILKTMRQLALHASNSGITSPSQVAADQAEVDSSIQTIDRIANTTKYSTTFLLNGSQDLTYDRTTTVDKATDIELLDLGKTRFEQVFKKEDYKVNVTFSGANDADESYTDGANQATRAMFEATSDVSGTDIDATNLNTLSADQRFTITGTQGSRSFQFGQGTHLGEMVTSINNVSDSTGVSAQLVFNNTVGGTTQDTTTQADIYRGTNGAGNARATGEIATYHLDSTYAETTDIDKTVTVADSGGGTGTDNVDVGRNTDGFGRVWVKWTSDNDAADNGTFEVYKDENLTMKIGEGQSGVEGLSFIREAALGTTDTLTIDGGDNVRKDEITMIQLGSAHEFDGSEFDTSTLTSIGLVDETSGQNTLSGVQLGYNTDQNGKLYFKVNVESGAGNADGSVKVYKDSQMREEDLVAQATGIEMSDFDANDDGDFTIDLAAVKLNNGAGPSSGLYGSLVFDEGAFGVGAESSELTGDLSFEQLGARLYANEYGADKYVKVDAQEGALWSSYSDAGDPSTAALLDANSGAVGTTVYGQDATVTVNGRKMALDDGVRGTVANQDANAQFVFNEGSLGATTIAQTGYNSGSIYARAQELNRIGDVSNEGNYATNAIQNTTETLDSFLGGMQFQLGEGQGDQERTVYAIRSMAVANLGQTSFYDEFEAEGLKESRTLTLQDVLGGGYASLATDPNKALTIIDQAVDDVSELRAKLGAFQANMLQTNANSLNVAIENITATESDIRDADMAKVSTEFTKNQILVQAGTAMLAQANVTQQNVLQLLG